MSRTGLVYSDRAAPTRTFEGFDPDVPVAGFYRHRLVSGGMYVGIRIWFGPPKDPVTGEELDRSPRWQAEANGAYIDLERVWPRCARDPIPKATHDYLAAQQRWGEEHAPDAPQANPHKRVDPLSSPLLF
ncbi:hypothetical protein [Sphingomonas sp.]|uniref:hypothetical protein n=1 Tax=Sphingomonas sp. TaxID=28214 RepID=UPI00307DB547